MSGCDLVWNSVNLARKSSTMLFKKKLAFAVIPNIFFFKSQYSVNFNAGWKFLGIYNGGVSEKQCSSLLATA